MSKTVIICGAGVDKSSGLDFPLATELVPQIEQYLETDEGKKIDKALRKILPGLRFSYDKFIKNAIDKLSNEFRGQVAAIVKNIDKEIEKEEVAEDDKKLGKLINALLKKIQKLQKDVKMDNETEELIKAVFGEDIGTIDDENIIELPKLTFSEIFNTVMRKIFEQSLHEPQNPILKHVSSNLMDFERLLMDNFIGFYTNSAPQMKNYMYLSWTLWAYLKNKENAILGSISEQELPFYSVLPEDWHMVTLNYTSFAKIRDNHSLYFHGNLSEFVRMKDRQLCSIDNHSKICISEFIEKIVGENTNFPKKKTPNCVIPSIIPPLKMKPVLSNAFIEIWYNAKKVITGATKIIVAGYSFNYADEHFNDIIRNNKDKDILIVDPYAESVVSNLENIFSYRMDNYVKNKVQGKSSYSKDNLKIIKASATEIDWGNI